MAALINGCYPLCTGYPGPYGGRWTMQYVYLQYIINNLPKLLRAPEYAASAWIFIILLESPLH